MDLIVVRAAATKPGKRNVHLALSSFRRKQILHHPAELIRDEFANYIHAITGFARRHDHGSAGLPPFEYLPIELLPVSRTSGLGGIVKPARLTGTPSKARW